MTEVQKGKFRLAISNNLIRKILAFHFNLMPTKLLGQFCFDLFEAGFESDEVCRYAGCASDLDRDAIKHAIESSLAQHTSSMPSFGDESSLCLLWYYVESNNIDLNKLDFKALYEIATFVFSHCFSFCEPYEGVHCVMHCMEDDFQLSLCHYQEDENARLLSEYINEMKKLYSLSLSQPFFLQFSDRN